MMSNVATEADAHTCIQGKPPTKKPCPLFTRFIHALKTCHFIHILHFMISLQAHPAACEQLGHHPQHGGLVHHFSLQTPAPIEHSTTTNIKVGQQLASSSRHSRVLLAASHLARAYVVSAVIGHAGTKMKSEGGNKYSPLMQARAWGRLVSSPMQAGTATSNCTHSHAGGNAAPCGWQVCWRVQRSVSRYQANPTLFCELKYLPTVTAESVPAQKQ